MRKVGSSFTFCNRISTCCVFYRPKVNLFATSDVTSVNGVTPAQFYPIRSQYSRNSQQPNLLQDICCKTCTSYTFLLPFYRSFKELVFIDPLICMFLFSQCRSCNNTQEDCFFFQFVFLFAAYASIIVEKTTGRLFLRPSLGGQTIQAKKVYLR